MTARIAMAVFELAGAQARTMNSGVFEDETVGRAAVKVMDALRAEPPTIPRAETC